MAEPQSVILPEGSGHGIFLTFNLVAGRQDTLRAAAAELPGLTTGIADRDATADLVSGIAFGAEIWETLYPSCWPGDLHPFVPFSANGRSAPATPADIFVHIRSGRRDLNFILARELRGRLDNSVSLVEEIHGFRYLDARDMTGFVDGTENPTGEHRTEVALIPEGAPFAGGSYVAIQRYIHDLARWEAEPVGTQEDTFGRTKAENVEYASDDKAPTAHTRRTSLREDGRKLEILRQSMPYGDSSEAGLYFIAYGASLHPFEAMLESMICGDREGHYDHLMNYTRAVTGASFFMPSVDFLRAEG